MFHALAALLTIVNSYLQSVLRRQNNLNSAQLEALETACIETERTIILLVAEVASMVEKYSERM
jgi:hypothetical protein